MSTKRIFQIALSVAAVLAVVPGAHRAAVHFDAYELVWLIPILPAFTVIFFWIVIVMVNHFVAANSYRDAAAIARANSFLVFFEGALWLVFALFLVAGRVLYLYFHP